MSAMIRRFNGDLVGPFFTEEEAAEYLRPGDSVVHLNEHGVVIDYAPQFDEGDPIR